MWREFSYSLCVLSLLGDGELLLEVGDLMMIIFGCTVWADLPCELLLLLLLLLLFVIISEYLSWEDLVEEKRRHITPAKTIRNTGM